jgi:hypothetical protein
MSKKYELTENGYTITLKNGSKLSLGRDLHKNLIVDYCANKTSVENICLKYGFSKSGFESYRRALGFTRDSVPVSDEEVLELSEDDLARVIVERKAAALEKAQDFYIEKIKKDAESWQNFQSGVLNPFEKSLNNFKPRESLKIAANQINKNGRYFVVSLNDLQIGLVADERDLYRQVGWSTEKAKEALGKLLSKIVEDVKNDKVGFEGCVCILGGDLFHGLRGATEKGTQLEVDCYRATQCDAILEILYSFVGKLNEVFGKIVVHSVQGNHGGSYDYPVVMALKGYFRAVKTIEINVYSNRTAVFKISNTMVILDHGASAQFKADVPSGGKPRESYVQSLILAKSSIYSECNSAIFIQNDKHHWEHHEFNDFEFIMMGALPMGDQYSDNLNLHSRARQNCLIIDKTGLKSVNHYYIDSL